MDHIDDEQDKIILDCQEFTQSLSDGVALKSKDGHTSKVIYSLKELPVNVEFKTKRESVLKRISITEFSIANKFIVLTENGAVLMNEEEFENHNSEKPSIKRTQSTPPQKNSNQQTKTQRSIHGSHIVRTNHSGPTTRSKSKAMESNIQRSSTPPISKSSKSPNQNLKTVSRNSESAKPSLISKWFSKRPKDTQEQIAKLEKLGIKQQFDVDGKAALPPVQPSPNSIEARLKAKTEQKRREQQLNARLNDKLAAKRKSIAQQKKQKQQQQTTKPMENQSETKQIETVVENASNDLNNVKKTDDDKNNNDKNNDENNDDKLSENSFEMISNDKKENESNDVVLEQSSSVSSFFGAFVGRLVGNDATTTTTVESKSSETSVVAVQNDVDATITTAVASQTTVTDTTMNSVNEQNESTTTTTTTSSQSLAIVTTTSDNDDNDDNNDDNNESLSLVRVASTAAEKGKSTATMLARFLGDDDDSCSSDSEHVPDETGVVTNAAADDHAADNAAAPIEPLSLAELRALKARQTSPAIAPFNIDGQTARKTFDDWRSSLLAVPADFAAQAQLAVQRALFIPYYYFSAVATSLHVGTIGFAQQAGQVDWKEGQDAVTSHLLQHVRACALCPNSKNNNVNNDNNDIKSIESTPSIDNNVNIQVFNHKDFHNNDKLPKAAATSIARSIVRKIEADFDHSMARQDETLLSAAELLVPACGWKYVYARKLRRQLLLNERYGAADKLKQFHHAQLTKGPITTTTELNTLGYRLVYMPVYVFEYEYSGEHYTFVVNGQNGVAHGKRPYGVGQATATTLRALTGNFLAGGASVKLVQGCDLNAQDQVDVYDAQRFYLLLPSSDQLLFFGSSVGWAIIANTGEHPVEIAAQRRMRQSNETTLVLQPGARQRLAFRGHWLVRIVDGNAAHLQCLSVGTSGGDESDDALQMCQ